MKKINCLQLFFGYDDYECEMVFDYKPILTRINERTAFLIPMISQDYHNIRNYKSSYKTALKLPYYYDSMHNILHFTFKGQLTPGMNLYTEAVYNFISPVMLKGIFSNDKDEEGAAIIKDKCYVEPDDENALYISHSLKTILVYRTPYFRNDQANGNPLSNILECGYTEEGKVLDKHYLSNFTRMCKDNVLSISPKLFYMLKYVPNICTISQVLRACERPEDDIDFEKLKNIEQMLASSDNTTKNLGLMSLSTMNFWKYRNTLALMFNRNGVKSELPSTENIDSVKMLNNFETTYRLFSLYYNYDKYIRREDWKLMQQYLKSIGESDSNLKELYRCFAFDFINRSKMTINFEP